MSDSKAVESKKSTNPLVIVGIGCLVLLIVIGVVSAVVMKYFAKNIGTNMLEKAIESQTGVKTNLTDLEDGKMTITDKKTGTSIDIGSNTIPATFPKDFPLYSGMKLTSSMSGSEKASGSGFWLTFSSPDSVKVIESYYKAALVKNGWKETAAFTAGDTSTLTVEKKDFSGTLSISRPDESSETSVIIMIGDDGRSSEGDDANEN